MNGISELMHFMKYLILQLLDARHTNPPLVPQHTFHIFQKTGRLLFLDIALNLFDLLIFYLTFLNLLKQIRSNFHFCGFCVSDNPQVELVELFTQLK
jgi:hypothetical protein